MTQLPKHIEGETGSKMDEYLRHMSLKSAVVGGGASETASSATGSDSQVDDSDIVSVTSDMSDDTPLEPLRGPTGRKVLVTGGAGFVGSHVADALLTRGDSVIIVDEMNDYYDTTLKRSNLDYLVKKHGTSSLRIVEVSPLSFHPLPCSCSVPCPPPTLCASVSPPLFPSAAHRPTSVMPRRWSVSS